MSLLVQILRGSQRVFGQWEIRISETHVHLTFRPDRQRNPLRPGDQITIKPADIQWSSKAFELPRANFCVLKMIYKGLVKPEVSLACAIDNWIQNSPRCPSLISAR